MELETASSLTVQSSVLDHAPLAELLPLQGEALLLHIPIVLGGTEFIVLRVHIARRLLVANSRARTLGIRGLVAVHEELGRLGLLGRQLVRPGRLWVVQACLRYVQGELRFVRGCRHVRL